MNEVVERIARDVWFRNGVKIDAQSEANAQRIVRGVLMAISEPTLVMIKAGSRAFSGTAFISDYYLAKAFTAMIKEILK